MGPRGPVRRAGHSLLSHVAGDATNPHDAPKRPGRRAKCGDVGAIAPTMLQSSQSGSRFGALWAFARRETHPLAAKYRADHLMGPRPARGRGAPAAGAT